MSAKLGPYKKSLDYSYAIGVYPTLELLAHQPAHEHDHGAYQVCAHHRVAFHGLLFGSLVEHRSLQIVRRSWVGAKTAGEPVGGER